MSTYPQAEIPKSSYGGEDGVDQPRWFALYTCSRREKVVAGQLHNRGLESYLPLYSVRRRWNQRECELQLPLFPGYLFVKVPYRDRVKALAVNGVVEMVQFAGKPAVITDTEIDSIRLLSGTGKAQPHPFLSAGRGVRVRVGPLAGLEGTIVRIKSQMRVVVNIPVILQAVAVEIAAEDLELLPRERQAA
jgi:transcription antitermination factor NusG